MISDARAIESAGRLESYITAVPTPGGSHRNQAREVFGEVKRILAANNAVLLQERVFASQDAMATLPAIRDEIYGDLDDGVPPSWLLTPKTAVGEVAGVQVHALRSDSPVSVIEMAGKPAGRVIKWGDCRYLAVSGLVPTVNGSLDAAAQSLLEDTESILRQAGCEFQSLTRTWFWLGDILSWYDVFNGVRTEFFSKRGMISTQPGGEDLPASTGIGVRPRGEAPCALDFVTVTGPCRLNTNLLAAGNQNSAFRYGSAFSRAAKAATPAGETVYVSGTAAIDAEGRTQHIGDPAGPDPDQPSKTFAACLPTLIVPIPTSSTLSPTARHPKSKVCGRAFEPKSPGHSSRSSRISAGTICYLKWKQPPCVGRVRPCFTPGTSSGFISHPAFEDFLEFVLAAAFADRGETNNRDDIHRGDHAVVDAREESSSRLPGFGIPDSLFRPPSSSGRQRV